MTKISVALCTFNGEAYLGTQLRSILEQTRIPDEAIVCDDASTDATLCILEEFASAAPFQVRLVRNPQSLGVRKNFQQAISLCSGDLIALSDQDDVWHRDRLLRSEERLNANPSVGLVFSDGSLIDSSGKELGSSLWDQVRFTPAIRHSLTRGDYTWCVRRRFVTGATVMFRASLRSHCMPVGEHWIHDEWLAAATPLFADILPLEEKLISYRRHSNQAVGITGKEPAGAKTRRGFDMVRSAAEAGAHWAFIDALLGATRELCSRFATTPLSETGAVRLAEYRRVEALLSFRAGLPRHRLQRLLPVLQQLRRYLRYAGLSQLCKDLLASRAVQQD